MAKQVISLGSAPSGAGGDDRRSAWLKARSNFTEIYNWLANTTQTDEQPTPLPAALPLAKGGTGQTSLVGLITALLGDGMYGRSNVVGAVGQNAGTPTGAVLEYGSNSNGKYLKLADGTLICWFYSASAYSITNALSSELFASNTISMTFPMAFSAGAGVPVVIPVPISGANYFSWAAMEAYGANSSQCSMRLISRVNTATAFAAYIAIGRWF